MCIGNCNFVRLHDYEIQYIRKKETMKKKTEKIYSDCISRTTCTYTFHCHRRQRIERNRCLFLERNAIQLQKFVFRFENNFYCFQINL